MTLLEHLGWKEWPVGGAKLSANMDCVFSRIVEKGITEVELDEEELEGFIRAYSTQIIAEELIRKGNLKFRGVSIKVK